MTTLNRAASKIALESGVRAATDVTGFGLIGHASQLADASRVSLRLRPHRDWFLPRALDFVAEGVAPGGLHTNEKFFGASVHDAGLPAAMRLALFDPQTSGGLLLAVSPRRAAGLLQRLRRSRVWHVEIGEAMTRGDRSIELAVA